jgi:hypothetical protein
MAEVIWPALRDSAGRAVNFLSIAGSPPASGSST